ncbi:MAG: TonB-dependent receptor family protein [Myxococcota bacterium]
MRLWALALAFAPLVAHAEDGGALLSSDGGAAVELEGEVGHADGGEALDAAAIELEGEGVHADGGEAPDVAPHPSPLPEGEGRGVQRETVVTSERVVDVRRVAGSAHVLGKEELERHEYDDVHRLLQTVPGVYLRDEEGYGLRPNIGLRGASSDRSSKVTLMEDGVLFGPAPYSAPATYYFPLVTRMVGAEVYKGPASIRFGPNTIGGALNFRTREVPPAGRVGELDLAAGTYRSAKAHGLFGYGGERWGVLLEGVHLGSGGFKELDGGGPTGFAKNEAMAKLRYRVPLGEEGEVSTELKLQWADELSDETYLGLSAPDFAANSLRRYAASQNDQMSWRRLGGELHQRLSVGTFDLHAVAYRHQLVRTWRKLDRFRRGPDLRELLAYPDGGQAAVWMSLLRGEEDSANEDQSLMLGTNARAFVSQGVQLSGRWRGEHGSFSQQVELGARLHHDEVIRHHYEDGFAMLRGQLVPDGQATVDTARSTGFTRALAFYAQDELSYGGWLLVPGVRVERIDTALSNHLTGSFSAGRDVVLLPGVGLVRQLGQHVSLFSGAHQGFSPVSPGQPPEVEPEKSWNYEAGVRLRTRPLKAELVGFLNDYFNLTGECTLSAGCDEASLNRQYNGGAVRVYGAEAAASAKLGDVLGVALHLDAAYTLTLSEFLTSFVSEAPQFGRVQAGDQLPYVPVHQATTSVRAMAASWVVALTATYVSEMREVAGSGPIPPAEHAQAHLVLDFAAHRTVGDFSELYLTVNNLTDARYIGAHRPYGARPGAPLSGFLGFKHRF